MTQNDAVAKNGWKAKIPSLRHYVFERMYFSNSLHLDELVFITIEEKNCWVSSAGITDSSFFFVLQLEDRWTGVLLVQKDSIFAEFDAD